VDSGRPGHHASRGVVVLCRCRAGVMSSWRVYVVAFRCRSLGAVGDCGSGDKGWRRR
jgi:hypothetical protein